MTLFAQNNLNKNISVQANRQRLADVLEIISNKGKFNFSYNSNIIKRDSLVSLNISNKPVIEVLGYLFGNRYEYIESGNYIIIRRKPIPLTTTVKQSPAPEKNYYLTGYIVDEFTGDRIHNASIYEPTQLASDLTDEQGGFRIKLKSRYKTAIITISRELYRDTTIVIQPKMNQELVISLRPEIPAGSDITVSPEDYLLPDTIEVQLPNGETAAYTRTDSFGVQKTWIGKLLLSSKQKIQSLNLRKFFANRFFQLSLVPGISTQGKLSPQISTAFSVNLIGGFTGGVNAFEAGGVFNINKKRVTGFQAAGVFNLTGGSVRGFQAAGVHNHVLDTVRGFQAAGVSNYVNGRFTGMQAGGVYNHVSDSMKGFQTAGVVNFTRKRMKGLQIAGVANIAGQQMKGTQIAGVINYARHLKGIQIGVLNLADSSDGYSFGILNLVRKNGYHKISISTNEVTDLNVSLRTGSRKMYTALHAGMRLNPDEKLYSFGYGIGSDHKLNKHLFINTELSSHYLYAGTWDFLNLLNKFSLNLQWQPVKGVSVFAGPSFSVFVSDQLSGVSGYRYPAYSSVNKIYDFSARTKGWFGFNAGVNLF